MKNSIVPTASSKPPHWLRRLNAVWRWLTEPSPSVIEPERRLQARLLMTMLIVLIMMSLLSLMLSFSDIYAQTEDSESVGLTFQWITLISGLVLVIAYGLSRTVLYQVAAILLVITLLCATFLLTILNPGDSQFLYFLVLGGLIGSLFLSTRATTIIFAVTFIGLIFLPIFAPGFSAVRNVNAIVFILVVGGLVVLTTNVRERYLEQIDWQTQRLVESEARLRELSIHDPLTGLFNRRYLEDALTLEMIRAVRKGYSIGIIMADIDHFKQFNDTHGHAAGDAVLVQVGNFLQTHVRATDATCRYGGEEFILVLPEATERITKIRAEQMQQDARSIQVQFEEQPLETITLSLGVAVFPGHGSTYDSILGAADVALYRAKRDGRDRVVVAD